MLAHSLPVPVGYDAGVTITSMLIAVVISGFALFTVTRQTLTWRRVGAAGVLLGLGISAMHYTGMAAIRMDPPIVYDDTLFTLSVLIAIVASFAGLWIAFNLRRASSWMRSAKLGSALIIGLAIIGMHYTGMAAAHFPADGVCLSAPLGDNLWLAGTIAGVTLVILGATLGMSLMDARMARDARWAASLKQSNDELQRLALHDPLTMLPNRSLLEDRIQQAIARAERGKFMVGVLFIDLDRFKLVNDSLGHHVGDELLRAVAARLTAGVRGEDTVSRLGGDEFVVLLPHTATVDGAATLATKLLAALAEPFLIQEHELYVAASIGVSVFPRHGVTAQLLIRHADAAMYAAKRAGGCRFQIFTPEMNACLPQRLSLENDLRRAIARREFELHYQPKVSVHEGRVVGMEALVRWRHPTKGLVPPLDFIPLAEETGLIVPIGRWVIEEACSRNKAWQDAGLAKVPVAINISGVQFRQKELVQWIAEALASTQLAPEYLDIEITESVVMENAPEAVSTLETLSGMGIQLSIDDFGTGYSSLSYLKRFPIDRLKIDRSFIRDISSDGGDAAIVRATIALAHNLRLRVVAEGVETGAQLEILQSLGCDEYQGYYRSKPVPAEEFEAFLGADARSSASTPAAPCALLAAA